MHPRASGSDLDYHSSYSDGRYFGTYQEDLLKIVRRQKIVTIAAIVNAVIAYILIIILFIFYGRNNVLEKTVVQDPHTFIAASSARLQSSGVSSAAVSFSTQGPIQKGGGTSIYKNALSVTDYCPWRLSINAIYDSKYVLSYRNGATVTATSNTINSTLHVMDGSNPSAGTPLLSSTTSPNFQFFEIQTLSQSNGLLVGTTVSNSQVVAMKVDPITSQITYGPSVSYVNGASSKAPIITLSDTTFVITTYTPYAPGATSYAIAIFGTVDPTTLAITLNSPVIITSNAAFNIHPLTEKLTPTTFVVFYLDSTSTSMYGLYAEIKIDNSNNAYIALDNTTATKMIDVSVGETMYEAARIDDTTVVLVYNDLTTGRGITAQLVHVTNEFNIPDSQISNYFVPNDDGAKDTTSVVYKLQYGAKLEIKTGRSESKSAIGSPTLSVVPYTNDSQFAILFADSTLGGDMLMVVAQVTAANTIVAITPQIVLPTPDGNLNVNYRWGVMATGRSTIGNGQMAIAYSTSSISKPGKFSSVCTTQYPVYIAIMETLPKPIGIYQSSTGLTTSGTVDFDNVNFTPGLTYYTTTTGSIVQASVLSGLSTLSTPFNSPSGYETARLKEYVETNNMILLSDSKIGVAIDYNTLLIEKA